MMTPPENEKGPADAEPSNCYSNRYRSYVDLYALPYRFHAMKRLLTQSPVRLDISFHVMPSFRQRMMSGMFWSIFVGPPIVMTTGADAMSLFALGNS